MNLDAWDPLAQILFAIAAGLLAGSLLYMAYTLLDMALEALRMRRRVRR